MDKQKVREALNILYSASANIPMVREQQILLQTAANTIVAECDLNEAPSVVGKAGEAEAGTAG